MVADVFSHSVDCIHDRINIYRNGLLIPKGTVERGSVDGTRVS